MKWILFVTAFAGAFLLDFGPVFAASPVCSADTIATCEQLKKALLNLSGNKELGFPASQTGEVIFNGDAYTRTFGKNAENEAITKEMSRLSIPSPTQAAQAVKLGETLRDQAKKMIVGDRLAKFYSPEQRAAVARLDSLVIRIAPDEHKFCWKSVPDGYPNAAYDSETHSILICPATAKQTKAYLIHALSHEIGHSISPCVTKSTLYRLNGKSEEENRAHLDTCDSDFHYSESQSYNSPEASFAEALVSSKAKASIGFDNSRTHRQLETCNVLEEAAGTSIEKSDIFASTASCIDRKSAPILESDRQMLAAAIAKRDKTSMEKVLEGLPKTDIACSVLAQEEFADSFGVKLAAGAMKSNKQTSADVRAALVLFQATACDEKATGDKFRMKSEYPPAKERIQKYLSHPEIASVLGCSPATEAGICPLKFDPLPYTDKTAPARDSSSSPRSNH